MPFERGEIRRDPSVPNGWMEVMVTQAHPGEMLPPGPTERVTRKLVEIDPARVEELRAADKYVAMAQVNPDVWVAEE